MLVHVLTPGFTTPNGAAFLFPLIVWRDALSDAGLRIRFFPNESPALTAADVLIVDSKFHKHHWALSAQQVLDKFSGWRERCATLYFDTSDSSGWLQTRMLPVVDGYFKGQLLRDRTLYRRAFYGRRIYTDYYHATAGVEDAKPEFGEQVDSDGALSKLRVSWHSGLADYSLFGPLRMQAYQYLPLRKLLGFQKAFTSPQVARRLDVSCRFGVGYERKSVAWQRLRMRQLLAHRLPTEKLSRRAYFEELRNSKVVVSPFGLGEITLKDFEVFLTGGLLVKPDMQHMETWPDIFRAGETMLSHSWDLDDLEAVIDTALQRYAESIQIAEQGQAAYMRHTIDDEAGQQFASRLIRELQPFVRP